MLDDKPKLKKFVHRLLTNELTCRPRWWARVFVNPLFIKRGRGSVIRHSARLDLIPSKKFILGNHSIVESWTTINNGVGDVIIGNNSMITSGVTIVGPVKIGDNVIVGNGTLVFGMWHNYEDVNIPISMQGVGTKLTTIEDGAWIGGNVVINQGVAIGKHSLVGTGSVVTKDVPPYCIVAGVPAVVIKKYDHNKKAWVKV